MDAKIEKKYFFSLILIVFILTIVLATSFSMYQISKKSTLSEIASSTKKKLNTGNEFLSQKISSISNISIELSNNYELKKMLENYSDAPIVEQFYTDNYINNLLSNYIDSLIEISSIKTYLVGKKMSTQSIQSDETIVNTDLYKSLQVSDYTIDIQPCTPYAYTNNFNISLASTIKSSGKTLGYFQIMLANDYIVNSYLSSIKTSPQSSLFIVDTNGNLVASNNGIYPIQTNNIPEIFSSVITKTHSGFFTKKIDSSMFYVFYSQTNGYGLKTIEIIPISAITSLSVLKRNSIILFFLLLIITILLFSFLTSFMNKYSTAEQYRVEYQVLREKINPHFLYNILDAVSWKAYSTAPNISQTLSSIAKLYRKATKVGAYSILSDEIEYIKTYLELTKEYLNPNISFSIDCPEQLQRLIIPGFILQPLIENSLKHGFLNKAGDCILKITVKQVDDTLNISIYDNGNGMKDTSQNYFDDLEKNHMGINNIQKRIKLLFGKEYGLTYESELTNHTNAIIKLPLITEIPKK